MCMWLYVWKQTIRIFPMSIKQHIRSQHHPSGLFQIQTGSRVERPHDTCAVKPTFQWLAQGHACGKVGKVQPSVCSHKLTSTWVWRPQIGLQIRLLTFLHQDLYLWSTLRVRTSTNIFSHDQYRPTIQDVKQAMVPGETSKYWTGFSYQFSMVYHFSM